MKKRSADAPDGDTPARDQMPRMSGTMDNPIPKDTPGGDPKGVEIPSEPTEIVRPEMPNRPGDPGWDTLGPTQFPAEPSTGESSGGH